MTPPPRAPSGRPAVAPAPLHTAMGSGAEFDAIRVMLTRWGSLADGIGDDAAVLQPPIDEQLVVSVDAALDGVHFRTEWLSPQEIGARATAAALSDVAAMGARALGVLIALELPPAFVPQLPALADGIGHIVREANARILGGNITKGERLGVTTTVIGAASHPITRAGARPGDALWVTGTLGGPLRALQSWLADAEPTPNDRARFAAPTPRLREGAWLAAIGAHAMLDISDGLAADAGHMAAASRVMVELEGAAIPCVPGASMEDALASGEEYELLVATVDDLDPAAFRKRFGIPITRIGTIRACAPGEAPGVVWQADGQNIRDGARVALPAGHDHLSPS